MGARSGLKCRGFFACFLKTDVGTSGFRAAVTEQICTTYGNLM